MTPVPSVREGLQFMFVLFLALFLLNDIFIFALRSRVKRLESQLKALNEKLTKS